jgi:pentatricopeptide repeat protein
LARLERAYRNGDVEAKPNAATYNSMINCYAKSKSPDASDRAIKILESMKEMSLETDREDCHPDVITYTSVIDALSKTGTVEGSEMAGSLLEELEIAFFETGDRKMKPNIRTYTSVSNSETEYCAGV